MNLYLVTRREGTTPYGSYRSIIVVAPDHDEARWTHPVGGAWEDGVGWNRTIPRHLWTDDPERDLVVHHIGVANPGMSPGVIHQNYYGGK